MSFWPWRKGVEDAEKRLAEATEKTRDTPALAKTAYDVNNQLSGVIALNGFGQAILLAMKGR